MSASRVERIRFLGEEFVFVGASREEGAIAKPEDYASGLASYAHLCADGKVRRFLQVIGSASDITWLGPQDVEIEDAVEAIVNTLTHQSWRRP